MKLLIINGPNLNLLGIREKNIYGDKNFGVFLEELRPDFPDHELEYFQSNEEGAIITKIHETGFEYDGIIINAGAYTHTSIAIADAIAAITCPVVEVHISNLHKREDFRHVSYLGKNCVGTIMGLGLKSYKLAVQYLIDVE